MTKANFTILPFSGYVILKSYETPVAVWVDRDKAFYETDQKYSVTTTKHINKFFNDHFSGQGLKRFKVPQSLIDRFYDNNV